ncbi:hypothetical protein HRbin41_01495 [bacterium HR41]|nr:hypothetical protein HRbin41_01495 [bacterium HR41]
MREGVGIEVGVEQAIQVAQHVAVELGGDTGRVVVGALDHRNVFDEIDPDQQAVAVAHRLA